MSRGLNINNSSGMISTTDLTGHKVLKMGGSLTNYIHTGKPGKPDYFVRSNNKANTSKKNKFNFEKHILQPLALVFTIGVSCVALYKNKGKILSQAQNLPSNFQGIKQNANNFFSELGEKFKNKNNNQTNLFQKIKAKFSKNASNITSEASSETKTNRFSNFIESTKAKFKKAKPEKVTTNTSTQQPIVAEVLDNIADNSKNKTNATAEITPAIIDSVIVQPAKTAEAIEEIAEEAKPISKAAEQIIEEVNPSKGIIIQDTINDFVPDNTVHVPDKIETVKPFTPSEIEDLKILCGFDELNASVVQDTTKKATNIIENNIEQISRPKDEIQEIIDEVNSWTNIPKNGQDFETCYEQAKMAINLPPGEFVNELKKKAAKANSEITKEGIKPNIKAETKISAIEPKTLTEIENTDVQAPPTEILKPKDEIQEIIDEVNSWKDVPMDKEDVLICEAQAKAAMNLPAGEALDELQAEYELVDVPEIQFEPIDKTPGIRYSIYDPTTGETLGRPYEFDEFGNFNPVFEQNNPSKQRRKITPFSDK